MPYIKQSRRTRIADLDGGMIDVNSIATAGELNYALTELCRAYFTNNGINYQAINDVVGALEGAKAEFQRRIVANYEDRKITENGDVY